MPAVAAPAACFIWPAPLSGCCSGDEVLCGMLVDGEVDPFVKLAGLLHQVPEDQVGALDLPWGAV